MRKLKNLLNKLHLIFWSPGELVALRRLSNKFRFKAPATTLPLVIAVEGYLGSVAVAIYFTLLLLRLQIETSRAVKVVLFVNKEQHKLFKATRLYKIFFETTIICNSSYLTSDETASAEKCTTSLLEKVKIPDQLFNLRINGIPIGKDVYYAYIRNNLIGTVSYIDKSIQRILFEYVRNMHCCDKLIRHYNPELLLITDNCYELFGPYFYSFLNKHITTTITVPPGGGIGACVGRIYNELDEYEGLKRRYPLSFTDDTWNLLRVNFNDNASAEVESYLSERFSGNDTIYNGGYHKNTVYLSNCAMTEKIGINPSDKKIKVLVATHLLWDDPGYESLYHDYETWTRETLRIASNNKSATWIIKAHPSECHMSTNRRIRDIIRELYINELPDNIHFIDSNTELNTYSLIDYCDAVVTVRGTISFEATCRGKTVITAGYGPASGLNFVKEFETKELYEDYLSNIHNKDLTLSKEQLNIAKNALWGYLIKKIPISTALAKAVDVVSYSTLSYEALKQDETLTRFSYLLAKQTSGDLL